MSNRTTQDQSKFDQTTITDQHDPNLKNDHKRIIKSWKKSNNKNNQIINNSNKVRIIDNLNRRYY